MNLSRKTIAALFAGGATVWLAGLLVTPWESEGTVRSYIETIGSHPGQGAAAALLLFAGLVLMAPAIHGLWAIARERRSRLGAVGGGLAVLGITTMPGLLAVDFYAIALYENLSLNDAVRVEEAAQESVGAAVLGMCASIPLGLGMLLLLIGLVRSKVVAAWVPAVFVAGFAVSMAGGAPGFFIAAGVGLVATAAGTAHGLLRGESRAPAHVPAPAAA